MGSSYFGYPNMGNDRRTDVGGSSSKGKKGGSDKPKQPQRGLGVAQLEKIRLHGQLLSSNLHPSHQNSYHSSFNQDDDLRTQAAAYPHLPSSYFTLPSTDHYSYNSHFSMGNDYEKTSCDDAQSTNISSWISGTMHMQQMKSAPNLLNFNMEPGLQENNNNVSSPINKQYLEDQELDLELRLSR